MHADQASRHTTYRSGFRVPAALSLPGVDRLGDYAKPTRERGHGHPLPLCRVDQLAVPGATVPSLRGASGDHLFEVHGGMLHGGGGGWDWATLGGRRTLTLPWNYAATAAKLKADAPPEGA